MPGQVLHLEVADPLEFHPMHFERARQQPVELYVAPL